MCARESSVGLRRPSVITDSRNGTLRACCRTVLLPYDHVQSWPSAIPHPAAAFRPPAFFEPFLPPAAARRPPAPAGPVATH